MDSPLPYAIWPLIVSIGGNEQGARLSGVNITFWKWMVYVTAGILSGISGVTLAARLEAADSIVGIGWEFDAIAAAILGGTSFAKGKGGIAGTVLGVLLIGVARNGLNVSGVPSLWQPALMGSIVIIAIVFEIIHSRWREGSEMIPARAPAKIFTAARFIVLIVVCIAMAILTRSDEYGFVFLNGNNLLNIVRNASILIIIAVGQTITLTAKDVDLSVGSMLSLTSVIAAIMLKNYGFHTPAVVFVALLAGAFLGLINGLLITYVGLPPFIATYGMLWVLFGFAYLIVRGNVIYGLPLAFRVIGNGHIFGIPTPIIVMLMYLSPVIPSLYHTTLGRRFFATGANLETARMSGVKVNRVVITAYVISGFLAALAGLVLIA